MDWSIMFKKNQLLFLGIFLISCAISKPVVEQNIAQGNESKKDEVKVTPKPQKKDEVKVVKRVAVLELKNSSKGLVKDEELSFLSNLIRQASGRLPQDKFMVMTQENILALLPPETKLEDCVNECTITTGRMLGADYIVTGEVVKFGASLRVALKLHESASGALKSSDTISGNKVEELEGNIQGSAVGLFADLEPSLKRSAERLKKGFVYEKFSLVDAGALDQRKSEIPVLKQTEVKGINFGNVNVDALESYQQAIDLEKNEAVSFNDKKKAWEKLAQIDQSSDLGRLAKERIMIWENQIQERMQKENDYQKLHDQMVEIEKKRSLKRDEDWLKLSKLLKLTVISEEDKNNWVEAFIEAYGVHELLNPYYMQMDTKYRDVVKDRYEGLLAENKAELKNRLLILLKAPKGYWDQHDLFLWKFVDLGDVEDKDMGGVPEVIRKMSRKTGDFGSSLPEKIEARDILDVMRKNQPKIYHCKSLATETVKINVRVTIANTGTVQNTEILDEIHKTSLLGKCLEEKIKQFKFPAFNTPSMSVKLPFNF